MHASIVNESPLETALRDARKGGASDWHWGEKGVFWRVNGDLIPQKSGLSWQFILDALALPDVNDLDMAWQDSLGERYRLQIARTTDGIQVTARIIQTALPNVDACEIPQAPRDWMQQPHGLVLIAGATGSGKSTSMSGLILERVRKHPQHVVTLEDPVEFALSASGSRFTQRHVGVDTQTFATGIKAALRQDPDVIAIGELRDVETARWALLAAQTGHLVIASVHAQSAQQTVQRIVSLFGAEEQGHVRGILADTLNGVLVQELHRVSNGKRQAAFEVMCATPAVKALIREDRIVQIPGLIETSLAGGMISMTQSRRKLQIGSVRTSSL